MEVEQNQFSPAAIGGVPPTLENARGEIRGSYSWESRHAATALTSGVSVYMCVCVADHNHGRVKANPEWRVNKCNM